MLITIDGQEHQVEAEGRNLLDICLSLGYDLPYFCWHPAMHSVGACRQCAVKTFKDDKDQKGKMVMACMTAPTDGLVISISDPEVADFRRAVAEWLMVNHPHDCPVCDEGGECHLQDMTIMTGHVIRRCRFPKRTHRNQDLGPFVTHEMNRCIQCYRCVRFYRDYAGGRDFNVFGWHDDVYFGRFDDGTLQSEFAGNLVEVCPTGVFTDKTHAQHYVRKWDLQTAPSVCAHCGLGCNTFPAERAGMLRRIYARYNHDVNGYFLCDRGRFGYEVVNTPRRLRLPHRRDSVSDRLDPASVEQVRETLRELLGGHEIIGIGSARATVEANVALREFVGEGNFYQGVSAGAAAMQKQMVSILREGSVATASLGEVARCDGALILGDDVSNTAPMLALSLRQLVLQEPIRRAKELHVHPFEDSAVREATQIEKGPLYVAHPLPTRLDWLATGSLRLAPDDIARLGFAVAHALDPGAPEVADADAGLTGRAQEIADRLRATERPVIIAGYACGAPAVAQAAANVAHALKQAGTDPRLCFTLPSCNSLGLALLGGPSLDDALDRVSETPDSVLLVLETDLHREMNQQEADRLLRSAEHVVVLDFFENQTTRQADMVLPVASFAQSSGTLVNNEARAQRRFQVFPSGGDIQESWYWISTMAELRDGRRPWRELDDLILAADKLPGFSGLAAAAPLSGFRLAEQKIPRETARVSGRTALYADKTVHEQPPPPDPDSPFAFSMEGAALDPPAPLVPRLWAPRWNSVQAVARFTDRAAGIMRGGPSGRRLLEPSPDATRYATEMPAPYQPRPGQFLVFPDYYVFGSEELSMHSAGVAELAPQPHVSLNAAALTALGAGEGDNLKVQLPGAQLALPVKLQADLPDGVAAITVGLPGMPGMCLPSWGSISR